MALVLQRTSFPIVGGQEQGIAPELIEPPGLVVAHNVECHRQGELTKRFGWLFEPENSNVLPQPDKLMKRGNEILWIGESRGLQVNPRTNSSIFSRTVGESQENTKTAQTWTKRGDLPRFNLSILKEFSLNVPNARITQIDCAFAGSPGDLELRKGVLLVVYRYDNTPKRVDAAVIDIATGSILFHREIGSGAAADNGQIRAVALLHPDGWYFHIYVGMNGGWIQPNHVGSVSRVSISAAAPFSVSSFDPVLDNVNGWDVCVTDRESRILEYEDFEPRLYVGFTRNDDRRCFVIPFYPDASGALTTGSGAASTVGSAGDTAAMPNSYTVHMDCDPNGRHIIVAWNRGGSTAGNAADWFAQFGQGNSTDRTMTAEGQGPIGSGSTVSGSSTQGPGLQIGWAGHLTDYRSWKVTWAASAAQLTPWGIYSGVIDGANTPYMSVARYRYDLCWSPWSRIFSYRGASYTVAVRGGAEDVVGIEVISLPVFTEEVTLPPKAHGRLLAGRIATSVPSSLGGPHPNYFYHRGRNAVVESTIERGRFFTAIPTVSQNGLYHMVSVIDINASDPQQYNWTEYGGQTWIACGVPWCYDGYSGHEIGFSHRPQLYYNIPHVPAIPPSDVFADAIESSEFALTAGDYWVAMTWEAVDSSGRRAESAPSFANSGERVTVATGEGIHIYFMPLGTTSRALDNTHDRALPVVYVSNDGGQNYYRSLQDIPPFNSSSENSPVEFYLAPTALFLPGAPKLETITGILENDSLPAMRFVTAWQNRLWFANDSEIWYSCEIIDNEEPRFNRALSFKIPGKCSGLVGLDDRLIIFCEQPDSTYWISGDGPTDTGEGGSFTMPQLLSGVVTCIDARSICKTDKGVIFRSHAGFELLDRGLNIRRISGGIDRFIKEWGWSEVIASSLDTEHNIVRFLVRDPLIRWWCTMLCWHLDWEFWTTAAQPVASNMSFRTDAPAGLVRAANSNWIAMGDSPSNEVYPICALLRQSKTRKFDGADADGGRHVYFCSVETANIKFDGLRGFQRVWRAYCLIKNKGTGERNTGFAMGYSNDFSLLSSRFLGSSAENARAWQTEDDIDSGATASPDHWEYSIHIDQQQSAAIRLKFSDALVTGVDAVPVDTDLTFVGFGIEWGQEPGTGRGHWRSKK